ncbi:Ankyrin repeat, PH and SEC7 domain containing protein secG [Leucoagaricus sp. SymC.cos]|nr:Ankyrin repeat, PH and SEC7 domain containing protein secG [Leucoagaricus sp. SymC.cos]
MPVPLRAPHHRAEAKFNVTTEFPSLGLHSAASTGNVGLVEYALLHGQPVNSVIDGVLPLHAACAGGNVQVVKLLIEYGADVNAPRLPKRYSSRDSSNAPIIGSTGSTPLHFAAANGNREAIMLLLLHGAHADRPDKHGITPEALARQHGWIECADDLKQWILNKDKDLRDRAEFVVSDDRDHGKRRNRIGSFGDQESSQPPRRRLHVKQSIDTALNMLKSSSSNLAEVYHRGNHTPTPPTSPTRPFSDHSSALGASNNDFPDPSGRRPSLSHVIQSDSFPRPRKPSAQSTNTHRPRSAGEGAEEAASNTYTRTARRLGSKVSLLNLFRKGQTSDDNTNINLPLSDAPSLSSSPPAISGSSLAQHRQRPHQDSDASTRSRKTADVLPERKSSLNSQSRSPPMAIDLHNALAEAQRSNNRDRSRSNASSRYDYLADDSVQPVTGSYHSPGSSPLARLSMLRSQGHHRTRSGSGSSLGHDVNVPSRLGIASTTPADDISSESRVGGAGADLDNSSRSLPRSGILRPHNRNGSNGQGQMTPSALRAFSAHNRETDSHSPSPRAAPTRLKQSSSVGSLARADSYSRRRRSMRPGSAGSMEGSKHEEGNDDDAPIEEEQEEEEEYGNPIEATEASLLIGVTKAPSSRGSLSPIISNDHATKDCEDVLMAEFPFSINRPPPMPNEGDMGETETSSIPISTRNPSGTVDNRNRGDSLSSAGTTDSQEYSQTSNGSPPPPPPLPPSSQPQYQRRLPPPPLFSQSQPTHMHTNSASSLAPPSTTYVTGRSLSSRRTHTPFDIDISSISTHAQAEALVEKARQEVMELEGQDLDDETSSDGRTPLSARLAAYGESLALERRFRELKGGGSGANGVNISARLTNGERSATSTTASSTNLLLPVANQPSADSSKYAGSLYSGKSTGGFRDVSSRSVSTGFNGTVRAKKNSSRPSTAEGCE